MGQFNELLGELGRKISWETQVAALPASGKLEDTLHPLHPPMNKPENKAKANQGNLDDFIAGVNSMNTRR